MNKKLNLMILGISVILMIGLVSATTGSSGGSGGGGGCVGDSCSSDEITIVDGIIYQNDITNPVSGADVQVTCYHEKHDEIKEYTKSGVSNSEGEYSITFYKNHCDYGDSVTVYAQRDSLIGIEDGSITITQKICGIRLNIGIVNVPLVPEFGLIAGLTAILGSLGIFFVVRKK